MTPGGRYLAGLGLVVGAAAAVGAALGPGVRAGVWLAAGLALVVQGPLGWWLVRSVGTPRLLAVWAIGMLARLILLGGTAFVVLPATGLEPAPALVALAVLLILLLFLEGAVLIVEPRHSRA